MKLPSLSEKRMREFFKGEHDPINEEFFCRWVWWWRDLPKLTAPPEGDGNLLQFFLSGLRHEKPEHQQAMLDRWFEQELEMRLDGGENWKPAFLSVTLRAGVDEVLSFTDAGITAGMSWKEAEKRFREYFKALPKPRVSNNVRSVENWSRRFRVLELIDRATILGQDLDHDDLGPVRKLFRETRKSEKSIGKKRTPSTKQKAIISEVERLKAEGRKKRGIEP